MSEFQYIVRIVDTDLTGSKNVKYELTKIEGININFANAIVKVANIPLEKRVGDLKEHEAKKIEEIIKNPESYNIPHWLFNRQKDSESGKHRHQIGPDLTLKVKSDIDIMKETKSWKGIRHTFGLKVRGQKTKTTARSGRAVGVKRKRIRERLTK